MTFALLVSGTGAWLALGAVYFVPIPEVLRQFLVATATCGIGFGFIGLAERMIAREHTVITRAVEMSYAVYLFHLYIVFNLSGLAIQRGWDQHLSIAVVTLVGLILSVGCYFVFVRYTPLNWLLAGYSKSWFKWPFDRNGRTQKAAP